jgi:hypothetical protein
MDERTSESVAAKAARLMKHEDPDVRAVAASALTQAEDKAEPEDPPPDPG